MTKTDPIPTRHHAEGQPNVRGFFDEDTNTVSYLAWDPASLAAVVVDPVLAFDPATGKTSTAPSAILLDAAARLSLKIEWVLETHAHADHLSGAPFVRERTGAPVAIGEHIRDVQTIFRPVFDAADVSGEGREFDRLLADGDRLPLGEMEIEILHTPGHTPACVSYRIGDSVFVGDTLFMPDYGTARADFPGGDARRLYRSIRRLLALPSQTRMFMCHDYRPEGRDYNAWETTVEAQRALNVHVHDGVTEEDFVRQRRARDATLRAPRLLLPSIQVNIRAGRMPPPEPSGRRYLRIPVTGEN